MFSKSLLVACMLTESQALQLHQTFTGMPQFWTEFEEVGGKGGSE